MVKETLKVLQQMPQDFFSVFDHFGTLLIDCIDNWLCKHMEKELSKTKFFPVSIVKGTIKAYITPYVILD